MPTLILFIVFSYKIDILKDEISSIREPLLMASLGIKDVSKIKKNTINEPIISGDRSGECILLAK